MTKLKQNWDKVLMGFLTSAVVACASWTYATGQTVAVHGSQIQTLEKRLDRIEEKLDRLLERGH